MAALMSRLGRRISQRLSSFKPLGTHQREYVSTGVEEEDDVPYPVIRGKYPPGYWPEDPQDMHPMACWDWYDIEQEFINLPTIKQRLEHISTTEYSKEFGTPLYRYFPLNIRPYTLDYHQYITKTELVEGLPNVYKGINVTKDVSRVQPLIIDAIQEGQFRRADRRKCPKQRHLSSQLLVRQILMTLMTSLGHKYPHLMTCSHSDNVEIVSHWDRYNVERSLPRKSTAPFARPMTITPRFTQNNHKFQADQQVDILLRTEHPLPEFISLENPICRETDGPLEDFKYRPSSFGTIKEWKKLQTNPGFKIGDPDTFGYLAVLVSSRNEFDRMKMSYKAELEVIQDIKKSWGMNTLFTWTVAQAYHKGFNTYHNITYPFTSQGIVTDGQYFSFYAYQLNTLHLWKDNLSEPWKNLCWYTEEQKLFDIEQKGKTVEINSDVLEQLIKFLVISPKERNYDLMPTLPLDSPDKEEMKERWLADKVEVIKEVQEEKYDLS